MSVRVLRRALAFWLPAAAAATVLAFFSYGAVQQVLRASADDPQIQLAQDTAARLDTGEPAAAVVPGAKIDLARSLAPALFVFDKGGRLVATSAQLDGVDPDYPVGVFGSVKAEPHTVTWQPRTGVRLASVVVAYRDGFVVAARSLREVENRESRIELLMGLGWLAALAAAAAGALVAVYISPSP